MKNKKIATEKILSLLDCLVGGNNKEKLNNESKTSKKMYTFDVICKLAEILKNNKIERTIAIYNS